MAAALGTQALLAIGTAEPVDQPLEFVSESLQLVEEARYPPGFRGTRAQPEARTRQGSRQVTGAISLTPTPSELDDLLPWLGTSEVTDVFTPIEALTSRFVVIDRDVKVLTYSGVYVASATFSATRGGFLTVTLALQGVDEAVGAAGSFPALTLADESPYVMEDCVLTVGGTPYQFESLEMTYDNVVEVQFFNSLTPTRIQATDRVVTYRISAPYGDAEALHTFSASGVEVVATFTQGARSLKLDSDNVCFPRRSATVQSLGELFLQLEGRATKDAADAAEITFTNDITG